MGNEHTVITIYEGPSRLNAYCWKAGEPLSWHSMPIWESVHGVNLASPEHSAMAEFPRAFLLLGDQLYIGLSSGCVEQVDIRSRKRKARYGQRLTVDRMGNPQVASIRGLVSVGETVYDAGEGGLFETVSGKQLDDRIIGSVEVLDDMICVVPRGINPQKLRGRDFYDGAEEAHAGDLVVVPGNEIVMKRVEPFDGSGMSPGKHITANGKVYMHHSNWPDERITIRDLSDGKVVKEIPLMTSYGFVVHEGLMYDRRMCPGDGQRERITRVLRSDEGYDAPSGALVEELPGERLTSVASRGVEGLLAALYSEENNKTRVVNHLDRTTTLIEKDGVIRLEKA